MNTTALHAFHSTRWTLLRVGGLPALQRTTTPHVRSYSEDHHGDKLREVLKNRDISRTAEEETKVPMKVKDRKERDNLNVQPTNRAVSYLTGLGFEEQSAWVQPIPWGHLDSFQ